MAKRYVYFSTIDKDVRRVIGKKLYKASEQQNGGWIVTERSNGDAEYHLTPVAYSELLKYMFEHKQSRLYNAWTGIKDGNNIRFFIDSWQ